MEGLYIGTSGYSYADWVGPVYPEGTPKGEFLALYAARFDFVELNFSYYSMPTAVNVQRMVERTPPGFVFSIKAHRSLTHEIEGVIAGQADLFKEGIAPLVEADRLGAVLLQFPYSFHYEPDARRYLDRLCRLLEPLPLAVEFRNSEWQRDSVFTAMRQRGIGYVNVDEPDLPRLPRPSDTVTADLSYVRFHGRNRENWWKGDNSSRYDYLYSDDELVDWMSRVLRIMEKSRYLIVAFNNHFRGQAVRNANRLRHLITERGSGPAR